MDQLKTKSIKKRSLSKMMWVVQAYKDLRMQKLSDIVNFDVKIFESDIEKIDMLDKEKFEHSMCHFIAEVTKQKDG